MINNPTGTIDKIRSIGKYPSTLLRFTIVTNDSLINCVTCDPTIYNELMILEDGKVIASVFGTYNSRKQLAVKKLAFVNHVPFYKERRA